MVAHVNVHNYILTANCLASAWEGSTCNHRDYINVVATAKFYIDEKNPNDIKAELNATADAEFGKDLVYMWMEDCKGDYLEILVEGGA